MIPWLQIDSAVVPGSLRPRGLGEVVGGGGAAGEAADALIDRRATMN